MRAARSKYTIAFSATCIALADIEHEHGDDDDDDGDDGDDDDDSSSSLSNQAPNKC